MTGKTSYANRLVNNTYHTSYISTIGKDLYTYTFNDNIVYLHDMAGLERYAHITDPYYEIATGAIVFWSPSVSKWIKKLGDIPYVVVSNDIDGEGIQINCENNINIIEPINQLYPKMEDSIEDTGILYDMFDYVWNTLKSIYTYYL